MTLEQIKEALAGTPNGANVMVVWERPVKLKKAYENMPMTKRTAMLCRLGVNYDNIGEVKEKRESGELPAQNAGLNGLEWIDFPRLLQSPKNGAIYLRLESATFKSVKTVKEYRIDGQLVEFDNWKHTMLSSEMPTEKEGHLTFNVGIDNIVTLHRFSIEVQEGEGEAVNL